MNKTVETRAEYKLRQRLIDAEITKLDDLEKVFLHEYEMGGLTGAQRIDCLKEQRRIVWLRSVLNGLIVPSEDREG